MDIPNAAEEPRRGPGRPRINRTDVSTPMRSEGEREPLRTRKRKGNFVVDKFAIPDGEIPPGTSYEWKRETVYGASDPSYDVMMREQGWLPVDVSRHPQFMPPGYKGPIRRDGLILCERPIELTQEAHQEERDKAIGVLRAKQQQLGVAPAGTMERTAPKITKTYERVDMEIPE